MEHTEDEMDFSILEIKTCPFCGGSAKVFLEDWRVSIRCRCGASLSRDINLDREDMQNILNALDEAKKLWNTERGRSNSVPVENKFESLSLSMLI